MSRISPVIPIMAMLWVLGVGVPELFSTDKNLQFTVVSNIARIWRCSVENLRRARHGLAPTVVRFVKVGDPDLSRLAVGKILSISTAWIGAATEELATRVLSFLCRPGHERSTAFRTEPFGILT